MFKNLPLRWAIIICFNPVIWFLKISLIFLIKHLKLKPKSKNFKSLKKKKKNCFLGANTIKSGKDVHMKLLKIKKRATIFLKYKVRNCITHFKNI